MTRTVAFVTVLFSPVLLPAQAGKTPPQAKYVAKYSQFDKKLTGDREILHALNRLGFGPRPGDLEAVKKMGLSKWIDLQLHPDRIPENPALTELVEPLMSAPAGPGGRISVLLGQAKMLVMNGQQLNQLLTQEQIRLLRTGTDKQALDLLATFPWEKQVQVLAAMPVVRQRLLPLLDADLRRRVMAAAPGLLGLRQPESNLAQAKVYQAIGSERQLQEVLVDFWFNHFNVDAGKGATGFMVAAYESDAIRPHVLGTFRDLLGATANSAAMMFYLDNWQSSVAPPQGPSQGVTTAQAPPAAPIVRLRIVLGQQKPRGLNENYARELMELHTLGVDGGYTQKDIIEVARCFTGWTMGANRNGIVAFGGAANGDFAYNDEMHDKGEKTVLGVTIPAGGGKEDGEKVLDILARHPSTARFISRELAERFVADDPPPALVERMAATFRSTGGDIRAVLTTLFHSKEFSSDGAYRSKLKTPLEFVVSAARAAGAQVEDAMPLVTEISSMGQPLYRKVEPTGYSNLGSKWVSAASLVERMNFALQLSQNQISGVKVDLDELSPVPETTARQVLFHEAEKETLEPIKAAIQDDSGPGSGFVAGMLLGSPEFQRR
jgi:uncharacterized protein (DUF1800 family)